MHFSLRLLHKGLDPENTAVSKPETTLMARVKVLHANVPMGSTSMGNDHFWWQADLEQVEHAAEHGRAPPADIRSRRIVLGGAARQQRAWSSHILSLAHVEPHLRAA